MIDQQLRLLTRLASSDGKVDIEELKLIRSLGNAHGLTDEQVQAIMDEPLEANIDFSELDEDERFEYLYNLVHLMKVDGEIYNQEIELCETIAKKLGYQLAAIYELYPHVHPKVKIPGEMKSLKQKVNKFLHI